MADFSILVNGRETAATDNPNIAANAFQIVLGAMMESNMQKFEATMIAHKDNHRITLTRTVTQANGQPFPEEKKPSSIITE